MSILTTQQPRFPGSTVADREALYAQILAILSTQEDAKSSVDFVALLRQPGKIREAYVVLHEALFAGPDETLSFDWQIKRPTDPAYVSVLASVVTLTPASPFGVQIPLTIAAAFEGVVLPAGTKVKIDRVLTNSNTAPANLAALEIAP
jgi:hypothetical protein